MKIAYFDCISGISGDMTLGALVDAGVELAALQQAIDSLKIPGCRLVATEVKRHGFRATHIEVQHEPEHAHRHLHHIVSMIEGSELTPAQQDLAKRIFQHIGEAEAKVHGSTLQKIHFHEVGAVDSIADICGAAVGLNLLGVDRIVASPIPTGTGVITIAHGRVSVPAPATAELLRGIPLVETSIACELTTPTGAAILATVADSYGPLPGMRIESIGYGAGTKELREQANVLRLIVGESVEGSTAVDQVWVLETNLDDISGELIAHCTTKLWEAGALDVYTTAVNMKKNRPGVVLTVLGPALLVPKLERIMFRETTTLGVRRWPVSRHKLERKAHTVETAWGPVAGKLAWIAGQPESFSPEFESCRSVAEAHQVPLKDVYEAAQQAYRSAGEAGS